MTRWTLAALGPFNTCATVPILPNFTDSNRVRLLSAESGVDQPLPTLRLR